MVKAFITRDCAKKIRVRYHLPRAVTEEFLGIFPDVEVKINRFSQIVQSAQDHFTLTDLSSLMIAGVIGGNELCVTFWQDNIEEGMAFFEYYLSSVYPEQIQYQAGECIEE